MLAWMGYAILAAAALGVAASCMDYAVAGRLRRRRVLWAAVLFASVVGPIAVSVSRGRSTSDSEVRGALASRGASASPLVSDRVLGSLWLFSSAIIALWLVANQRRLRRRLRAYPARMVDGERVLVATDFGPAVVGVLRPQIVLPEWAMAIGARELRMIVAHESEHRQARDPLLAAAALLAVVVMPWNAALWWQLRRLKLAIEIDCDRRVVAGHGDDAFAYGALLLATRERASRRTPALALAMAAMRSGLGRRVEALLDGHQRSVPQRLSAATAALVLAAAIGAVPAPRLSLARTAGSDAILPPAARADSHARTREALARAGVTRGEEGRLMVRVLPSGATRMMRLPASDSARSPR